MLGLIFLKHLSESFDEYHAEMEAKVDKGADPTDPDEYKAAGLFWMPQDARRTGLREKATDPPIGTLVNGCHACVPAPIVSWRAPVKITGARGVRYALVTR